MPSTLEDLLRPSLSRPADMAAAPYGNQAAMLTAFFGGPIAATGLFAINTWRLGRMSRDAVWLALALALCVGWIAFARSASVGLALKSELTDWLGSGALTIVQRLAALAVFLLALLRHRREQRSTDMLGLVRPRSWRVTIGLIVLGWACDAALAVWMT